MAHWTPKEIVSLSYPRLALQARITGIVIVRVIVGTDGSVKEVAAVSGHPLLAQEAQRNALNWKFEQSEANRDTSNEVFIVYRFVVKGNCAGKNCRQGFMVEYPNFVVVSSEIPPIEVSQGKIQ